MRNWLEVYNIARKELSKKINQRPSAYDIRTGSEEEKRKYKENF